jgi:hypothetical protein
MRGAAHEQAILCGLIAAIYEIGITPVFWQDEGGERLDVLPMVRPG